MPPPAHNAARRDAAAAVGFAQLGPDDVVAQDQESLAAEDPLTAAHAPVARDPADPLHLGAEAGLAADAGHVLGVFEQARGGEALGRAADDSTVAAGLAPSEHFFCFGGGGWGGGVSREGMIPGNYIRVH